MNLVKISNQFNSIVQSYVDMKFYHYGWTSDISHNVQNNYTRNTGTAKRFPSLHLDFPSERVTVTKNNVKTNATLTLIFSETQGYSSEANAPNGRSVVEIHNELKKLAINVISEFNRIGRSYTGLDTFGVVQAPLNFIYTANARNQRLCELITTIEVYYHDECPTFTADIASLNPPFNDVLGSGSDFEKE